MKATPKIESIFLRQGRQIINFLIVVIFLLLILPPWHLLLSARPNLSMIGAGISFTHPLGCDSLGRDLLVRLASALQEAVIPIWFAILMGGFLGLALAFYALVKEGAVSGILNILMSGLSAIPIGVFVFACAVWSEKVGIFCLVFCLAALACAITYLRIRDFARRDVQLGFWQAHNALGGTAAHRILFYGCFGAWKAQILQLLGVLLRVGVSIEAALSYLGFGVSEPKASFGNILAAHFELYLRGDARVLVIVSLALALTAAFPSAFISTTQKLIFFINIKRFPVVHSKQFSGNLPLNSPRSLDL